MYSNQKMSIRGAIRWMPLISQLKWHCITTPRWHPGNGTKRVHQMGTSEVTASMGIWLQLGNCNQMLRRWTLLVPCSDGHLVFLALHCQLRWTLLVPAESLGTCCIQALGILAIALSTGLLLNLRIRNVVLIIRAKLFNRKFKIVHQNVGGSN